jgi:flagellin-like protein
MKAITPVVSTILLIMITIAITGFFFAWFTGLLPLLFNSTEEQANQQQRIMGINAEFVSVGVDNSNNVLAIVRNIGSVSINRNELVIVAKDPAGTLIGTYPYTSGIEKNSVATIDTDIECSSGQVMTLTIDLYGIKDSTNLECT